MKKPILLFIIMLAPALVWGQAADPPKDLDYWTLYRDRLKQQLDQDGIKYPHGEDRLKSDCYPYIEAMDVFAKHRDDALRSAQEVQASKDPKIQVLFDDFMDLVDRAEDEGNKTLQIADIMLRVEDKFGPIPCATLTLRADLYGKCLYDNAKKYKFDHTITRGQVDLMLEKGLDDLEKGWTLEYGWYWPGEDHAPNPFVDEMLKEGAGVRDIAPYFELEKQRSRADGLMNRYLKDAVCVVPEKGHGYYLDLAKKYALSDARTYIEGFYAAVYGKVEIEVDGKREPAENALVVITDPHDGRTWRANADERGAYEIKGALLHKTCSPFTIIAEQGGDTAEDTYEGTLAKPDPQARLAKDLVIRRHRYSIEIEKSWSLESIGQFVPRAMPKEVQTTYVCKGVIPIRLIKSQTDPSRYTLEGKGTIKGVLTMAASNKKSRCVATVETADTFEFGGEFDPNGKPPILYLKGKHSYVKGDAVMECSTEGPWPMTFPSGESKGPDPWGMGLEAREGYTRDFSMFGATYRFTLHVK